MEQKGKISAEKLTMLNSLSIRNVVLIDKLDLDFRSGLSVLTGETGAGKSILLDSLGLILGNRAEASLIRRGEDKLSVTAVFSFDKKSHPVYALLNEYEIDAEDEIIIKRTLDTEGRGKIFINDQTVSQKLLKEIGKALAEVHGQFDNQGLLNPANHQEVLDSYGDYQSILLGTKEKFIAYKAAAKKRAEAEANISRAKSDEEALRHWIDELEKMHIKENEEEHLSQKRLELMNAEKIIESLSYAYSALSQNQDITSALRSAQSGIERANTLTSGKYDEIINLLEQALINSSEAISQIEDASSDIGVNQNELENIETRLFALKDLARKHNVSVKELPQTLEFFKQKLSTIELGEEGISNLKKIEEDAKLEYTKSAEELSKRRKLASSELDSKVMTELSPLKMDKAKFVTMIDKLDDNSWTENGFDNVYFTVSTNPNSPQGPINKIASGGELARFMLALKVNLAKSSSVTTMIFDEVDSGIGGATAQAVGDRLARLGSQVQVLVVTHSPQVASRGNHHFKVEKNTKDNITTTKVEELKGEAKKEEIARMLAGETITDEARAAAQALIG